MESKSIKICMIFSRMSITAWQRYWNCLLINLKSCYSSRMRFNFCLNWVKKEPLDCDLASTTARKSINDNVSGEKAKESGRQKEREKERGGGKKKARDMVIAHKKRELVFEWKLNFFDVLNFQLNALKEVNLNARDGKWKKYLCLAEWDGMKYIMRIVTDARAEKREMNERTINENSHLFFLFSTPVFTVINLLHKWKAVQRNPCF